MTDQPYDPSQKLRHDATDQETNASRQYLRDQHPLTESMITEVIAREYAAASVAEAMRVLRESAEQGLPLPINLELYVDIDEAQALVDAYRIAAVAAITQRDLRIAALETIKRERDGLVTSLHAELAEAKAASEACSVDWERAQGYKVENIRLRAEHAEVLSRDASETYRELRAENAALKERLAKETRAVDKVISDRNDLVVENHNLKERLAAAEEARIVVEDRVAVINALYEDKARLDWLENGGMRLINATREGCMLTVYEDTESGSTANHSPIGYQGVSLRDAIDAARSSSAPEGSSNGK